MRKSYVFHDEYTRYVTNVFIYDIEKIHWRGVHTSIDEYRIQSLNYYIGKS